MSEEKEIKKKAEYVCTLPKGATEKDIQNCIERACGYYLPKGYKLEDISIKEKTEEIGGILMTNQILHIVFVFSD